MMTKQKIVLGVSMPDNKSTNKARKIVECKAEGLISVVIDVEKNQLVLVGVGMDAAILVSSLHKKVGCTTIISVENVKSEEEKEEETTKEEKQEKEDAKNKNVA